MNPSNSLEQKLLIEKENISNSKTNSVIRSRFEKIDLNKKRNGILENKTFLIKVLFSILSLSEIILTIVFISKL